MLCRTSNLFYSVIQTKVFSKYYKMSILFVIRTPIKDEVWALVLHLKYINWYFGIWLSFYLSRTYLIYFIFISFLKKNFALPVREILQNWKKLAELTKNRKHSWVNVSNKLNECRCFFSFLTCTRSCKFPGPLFGFWRKIKNLNHLIWG